MKDTITVAKHDLKSIADIQYGFTAKANADPIGPKFLRITDIQDGRVDWNLVPFCKATEAEIAKFLLSPGEIVFARTGATTGKSFLIKDEVDAVFASYLIRVKPVGGHALPDYLAYYFQTPDYWDHVTAGTEGAAQGGFNASKLGRLEIPLPPLEEQKRIVAVLDQAFAALDRARAHTEANLADAEELFQTFKASLMEHPEGATEVVSLAEVASIETKLVDPREPPHLDLPHVGAGNMMTGSDTLVDVLTAREEKLKSGKHPFDSRTVLYSKIRPYLMKVARPNFDGLCSADVYPLTPDTKLDRNYLFHLLLSKHFTDYAISGSDRAGMPKVNRSHLFSYRFSLPQIDLQRDISTRIDSAMQLHQCMSNAYLKKLSDIADLRQALLQKAFSGQLTA